ncbi:hypothetical protein [Sphingomonas sp.]|uniref:hypothetical protein n=1 Tax=Sphingomonas sp. TaxID=28214 RepID=UPI002DD6992D|nr:hypothetical protein [Sphingomonas sp.]
MRIFSTVVALLAAAFSPQAFAKDDTPGSPLIAELERCLTIREDAGRLACTDVAARRLVDASKRKEVVVVDREEVKKTRRSLFGFQLPRIGLFGRDGPDDGQEVDRIEAPIARVTPVGYSKVTFTLDDGARWTTTDAWASAILPKPGAILIIKRGAMGSYMVSVKGAKAVRAMRIG